MTRVEIDLDDEDAIRLWAEFGDLAGRLPGEWVLIGGLMVQLHALESGVTRIRVTSDIDLLGQARPPGALAAIDEALRVEGFEVLGPDPDGFAHRYRRGGLIVDVVAPDGLNRAPQLGRGRRAVGVPGGSQALRRAEVVTVSVRGKEFELRRATLLGAILIKSRSITRHVDPEAQREDLLQLLALVDDPRAMATELKSTERIWLRQAERALDFDGPTQIPTETVRRARLAYRLLVRRQSI